MKVTEYVELVESGEDVEEDIQEHEDDAVGAGHPPTVQVRHQQQQYHSGQQRQCRVRQPCNTCSNQKFYYQAFRHL